MTYNNTINTRKNEEQTVLIMILRAKQENTIYSKKLMQGKNSKIHAKSPTISIGKIKGQRNCNEYYKKLYNCYFIMKKNTKKSIS